MFHYGRAIPFGGNSPTAGSTIHELVRDSLGNFTLDSEASVELDGGLVVVFFAP